MCQVNACEYQDTVMCQKNTCECQDTVMCQVNTCEYQDTVMCQVNTWVVGDCCVGLHHDIIQNRFNIVYFFFYLFVVFGLILKQFFMISRWRPTQQSPTSHGEYKGLNVWLAVD